MIGCRPSPSALFLRKTLDAWDPSQLFAGYNITLQVRQPFLRGGFHLPAAPLDFSHEHRALDRGDAKISHLLRVRLFGEPALSLFFEKESRNLAFHRPAMRMKVRQPRMKRHGRILDICTRLSFAPASDPITPLPLGLETRENRMTKPHGYGNFELWRPCG